MQKKNKNDTVVTIFMTFRFTDIVSRQIKYTREIEVDLFWKSTGSKITIVEETARYPALAAYIKDLGQQVCSSLQMKEMFVTS